jgi:hypothetical protein
MVPAAETCIFDSLHPNPPARKHNPTRYRLLVFRPFNGEVLVGTVHKSTPQGLWLSVGFFQDVLVPPQFMPDGSEWDEAVGCRTLEAYAHRSSYDVSLACTPLDPPSACSPAGHFRQ